MMALSRQATLDYLVTLATHFDRTGEDLLEGAALPAQARACVFSVEDRQEIEGYERALKALVREDFLGGAAAFAKAVQHEDSVIACVGAEKAEAFYGRMEELCRDEADALDVQIFYTQLMKLEKKWSVLKAHYKQVVDPDRVIPLTSSFHNATVSDWFRSFGMPVLAAAFAPAPALAA